MHPQMIIPPWVRTGSRMDGFKIWAENRHLILRERTMARVDCGSRWKQRRGKSTYMGRM